MAYIMYMYVNKRVELAQRGIALYKNVFIIIIIIIIIATCRVVTASNGEIVHTDSLPSHVVQCDVHSSQHVVNG